MAQTFSNGDLIFFNLHPSSLWLIFFIPIYSSLLFTPYASASSHAAAYNGLQSELVQLAQPACSASHNYSAEFIPLMFLLFCVDSVCSAIICTVLYLYCMCCWHCFHYNFSFTHWLSLHLSQSLHFMQPV